jgi:hypothetical protein
MSPAGQAAARLDLLRWRTLGHGGGLQIASQFCYYILSEKPFLIKGDLEILQGLAVAGIFGVNSTESEGEQTGIIREQIPSGSRAVMIF